MSVTVAIGLVISIFLGGIIGYAISARREYKAMQKLHNGYRILLVPKGEKSEAILLKYHQDLSNMSLPENKRRLRAVEVADD